MTNCKKCPIKKECSKIDLYIKKGESQNKRVCPLLFLINKYIVNPILLSSEEKIPSKKEGGTKAA